MHRNSTCCRLLGQYAQAAGGGCALISEVVAKTRSCRCCAHACKLRALPVLQLATVLKALLVRQGKASNITAMCCVISRGCLRCPGLRRPEAAGLQAVFWHATERAAWCLQQQHD